MAQEQIKFTKMHGIGNDYIYIDCTKAMPDDPEGLSREMSDRHFGIGSDGIILILPSDKADFRMRIFNADGSEARMCGNGSRCVGKYVYDHGLTDKMQLTLETLAGIKVLDLHLDENGAVGSVTVDMGEPTADVDMVPVRSGEKQMIDADVAISSGKLPYQWAILMVWFLSMIFLKSIFIPWGGNWNYIQCGPTGRILSSPEYYHLT